MSDSKYIQGLEGLAKTMAAGPAKLTYFAGYGRAEPIRWALAAAGVEFEQVAMQSREEFLALQAADKLLFGQTPLLEIDGLDLVQTQAILRYVSRRGGLSGKSPAEEALVDMVCEGVNDGRLPILMVPFADDPEETRKNFPNAVERKMKEFEAALAKADGHFVASGLSIADVLLAEMAHELDSFCPGSLDCYPRVKAIREEVVKLPGVAAYLESDKRYPLPVGDVGQTYKQNVVTVLGW